MFIGTDKISEIVNDSDSDGISCSELSNSDTCTVEYILIGIKKKNIFNNPTHEGVMQDISAGFGVCVRIFTPHTQFLFECLRIGSSHY
jgi:hypothetical protein